MYQIPDQDKKLFDKDDLEGTFTTWAWRWTRVFTNSIDSETLVYFHIDERNLLLYVWWPQSGGPRRFGIYNLITGAVVYESAAGVNYWGYILQTNEAPPTANASCESGAASRERYVVVLRGDLHTVEMWHNGAILQSIDAWTYAPLCSVYQICMSNSGKWFVMRTHTGVAAGRCMVVFEGT